MRCGYWRYRSVIVKLILLLTALLFSSVTWAEKTNVIEAGVWPNTLKKISGEKETREIVFSSHSITIEAQELLKPMTIKVDDNTVIYVPSGAHVRAKPKVYTHPELADEVESFYLQGVGNYAFWATLIGVAAAIQ